MTKTVLAQAADVAGEGVKELAQAIKGSAMPVETLFMQELVTEAVLAHPRSCIAHRDFFPGLPNGEAVAPPSPFPRSP